MASSSGASRFDTQFPASAVAGQATFSGCLAVVRVAPQALRSRLPASVSLPPDSADEYPCLLAFGEQLEGAAVFGGLTVPLGVRYRELMVAIPFVSWDRVPGDHLFVSGMVCDFWPAVWNGNTYWGFSKRFAPMSWDGGRLLVQGGEGVVDFCGVVNAGSRTSWEAFDWIQSAAALPVLGLRDNGTVVRSRFEWDFQAAAVESAWLDLTVAERFDELPHETAACHVCAYTVEGMRWRLGWPAAAP
jgi:hypothetical protein